MLLQFSTRYFLQPQEGERGLHVPDLVSFYSQNQSPDLPNLYQSTAQHGKVLTSVRSFFTFCGIFLEVASVWAYRKENAAPVHEKNGAPGGPRPPLDAPAEPAASAAPAGTV